MMIMMTNLPAVFRWGVIPVESPTVPKAELTSKNTGKKELPVVMSWVERIMNVELEMNARTRISRVELLSSVVGSSALCQAMT
jgi:hypothetical protein